MQQLFYHAIMQIETTFMKANKQSFLLTGKQFQLTYFDGMLLVFLFVVALLMSLFQIW